MLISVNQFRNWLRGSAKTLREGGALATADVYEEIEQQLANEVADVIDADREELREARQLAANTIPPRNLLKLEKAGLMVVSSAWRGQ